MIEQDTIKLLRECDAGIRMGLDAIRDVLDRVRDRELRRVLDESLHQHEKLDRELQEALRRFSDEGKEPSPIAKSMSHMKTGLKMGLDDSDSTVAELITDGCNMGVKSLSRYLNQYAAADEMSKDVCKRLIKLEEELAVAMRDHL